MRKKNKILISAVLIVFVCVLIFSFWQKPALGAGDATLKKAGSTIANIVFIIISWILWIPAWLAGQLSLLVINLLIQVAKFNDIIKIDVVTTGWRTIRDLCNMFFIIVLLIMAFGTVLGVENWNYRRLLGRLILAAVLINFSKMFCGLLIDLGQMIMMTFVNAFKDAAPSVLVNATGLYNVSNLTTDTVKSFTNLSVGGTLLLNMVFVIVSFFVLLAIFLLLVVRIIMLWFLVIFSPLVWIGDLVPILSRYTSGWWEQFAKWIIIGPIMAFFLWFSLLMFKSVDIADKIGVPEVNEKGAVTATLSELSQSKNFLNYGFAVATLIMSLGFASQLGGKAASGIVGFAQKGIRGLEGGVKKLAKNFTYESGPAKWLKDYGVGLAKAEKERILLEDRPFGLNLRRWTKEGREEARLAREAKMQEFVGFEGAGEAAQQTLRLKAGRRFEEAGWLASEEQRSRLLQKHKKGTAEYEGILLKMADEGDFAGKGSEIGEKAGYNREFANILHEKTKKHDFAAGEKRWEKDEMTGVWKERDISKAIRGKVRGMNIGRWEEAFKDIYKDAGIGIDNKPKDDAAADKILGIENIDKFKKLSFTTKQDTVKAIALILANEKQFKLTPEKKQELEKKFELLEGSQLLSGNLTDIISQEKKNQEDRLKKKFEEAGATVERLEDLKTAKAAEKQELKDLKTAERKIKEAEISPELYKEVTKETEFAGRDFEKEKQREEKKLEKEERKETREKGKKWREIDETMSNQQLKRRYDAIRSRFAKLSSPDSGEYKKRIRELYEMYEESIMKRNLLSDIERIDDFRLQEYYDSIKKQKDELKDDDTKEYKEGIKNLYRKAEEEIETRKQKLIYAYELTKKMYDNIKPEDMEEYKDGVTEQYNKLEKEMKIKGLI